VADLEISEGIQRRPKGPKRPKNQGQNGWKSRQGWVLGQGGELLPISYRGFRSSVSSVIGALGFSPQTCYILLQF